MNNSSGLFRLSIKDLAKGAVIALFTGVALPLDAALQTPGFSLFTTDWHQLGMLALNGAVIGFVSYLLKNFLSTSDGKVAGVVG